MSRAEEQVDSLDQRGLWGYSLLILLMTPRRRRRSSTKISEYLFLIEYIAEPGDRSYYFPKWPPISFSLELGIPGMVPTVSNLNSWHLRLYTEVEALVYLAR